MVRSADIVVWLKDVDKHDSHLVGGKNANLGEMIRNGFPVPEGFAITATAYYKFLKENSLDEKIKHLLGTVNYDNTDSISQVSSHIKKIIKSSPVPDEIVKEIFSIYQKMTVKYDASYVAIRSSATSEDSKDASFAGQQETYLNIKGEAAVIDTVRLAWASLFESRALFYRHNAHLDQLKTGISLVVQKMVQSDTSGVMFTLDPMTNNKQRIVIEAIYGLGEYIVQGRVTPDHFEVDKNDFKIVDKKIVDQSIRLVYKKGENVRDFVPDRKKGEQKISDEKIQELAKIGRRIEMHYYFPQDIEWAIEKDKIYIVQTRPITTIHQKPKVKDEKFQSEVQITELRAQKILIGDGASPGIGIGKVRIIQNLKDISKIQHGDILVAPMTNPDYVPAMKKAAGIITERGGRTSHAAIVSREFGIPAIVGAAGALKRLRESQIVTVNGATGEVFSGSVAIKRDAVNENQEYRKTATKLLVNISNPDMAKQAASLPVDGIGLLRAEFMIAEIGVHPKKLLEQRREKVFVEKLSESLEKICAAFYPRPVLYRATDFKTNEYRNLEGGKLYEPIESNPMLGFRGAYRYMVDSKVFSLELQAIKNVREKKEYTNLNLMLPFVRTVNELKQVKSIISAHGLRRSNLFKLYMMVEIPSNVILIEDFIQEGIDGVSIGSNDLTMLTLGIDRDNEEVAHEFNERDQAMLWSYEKVIKAANKYKIASSICGQAPSVFPDLVQRLVELGVGSISVSPDAVFHTKEIIYKAEHSIIK